MASLRHLSYTFSIVFLILAYGYSYGQGSTLNSLADNDQYTVLRNLVVQPFDNSKSTLAHEHLIHGNTKRHIKYFIGSNAFLVQSDIDIYNNLIYADLDRDGTIHPYGYAPGRIDSFYVILKKDLDPIAKYLYHPKEKYFSKALDQGKYTIAEGIHFELQKGNRNPAIDFGSFEDKIVIEHINYLIDQGLWHEIPKNKKEFIPFVRTHFKKKIDKSIIKEKKIMGTLFWLNN